MQGIEGAKMNFQVTVRTSRGILVEIHQCASPQEGLRWFCTHYTETAGITVDHVLATCRKVGELELFWRVEVYQ